jgi:hypothetical protein
MICSFGFDRKIPGQNITQLNCVQFNSDAGGGWGRTISVPDNKVPDGFGVRNGGAVVPDN